ncbi:hypothetical protein [Paracoccus solventivorans]|uniref:hypothetical protein n=1 Tax=Paracoccus solventivorans TaxID=53463 RepID=UPI002D1FB0BF|nr:hypothetical protein [Paracoccus solventivorans]
MAAVTLDSPTVRQDVASEKLLNMQHGAAKMLAGRGVWYFLFETTTTLEPRRGGMRPESRILV